MQYRYWTLGGLGLLALGLGTLGFRAVSTPSPIATGTLTVIGQSALNVTPNQAVINLGDRATAKTAAAALTLGSKVTTAVIAAITQAGIKTSAIQTSGINLNANYGQSNQVTGYQASESLTITVSKLSLAGPLIDAATAAGANQVNGVTFNVLNSAASYPALYQAAVHDARAQANAAALAAGERVLGVKSMSVQDSATGTTINPPLAFYTAMASAKTPVEAGQNQLTAEATVVYIIGK